MKTNKNVAGFTLVELVVVIVIVAILSIVAVPTYRKYVRKSYVAEGHILLGLVQAAESAYFAENSVYLSVPTTAYNERLSIDVRANKYFNSFSVESNEDYGYNAKYTAVTTGRGPAEGISLTIEGYYQGPPSRYEDGI